MEKVFWIDPYQTSLITKVVEVSNDRFLFEKTIAYSFSGGQESDRAFINQMPILESKIEGKFIYYTLPPYHNLSVGDGVIMTIDWPRRYRLMRLHFAAELILEIVTQKFHLEKIGVHIAEDKAWIDFVYPDHISSLFEDILESYNEIILADYPIKTGFFDNTSERRFWKIDGFAKVPCEGTYVKSTKEVGFVTLKRARSGRTAERIQIYQISSVKEPPGG